MQVLPQLGEDALWKRRFRVAKMYTDVASNNPERGVVASNRSGVYQQYAWDVASGALTQLTNHPKGKPNGHLDPSGSYLYYFEDQDGNELGHFLRVPWHGGAAIDITPTLPAYATLGFTVSLDGTLIGLNLADEAGFHIYLLDLVDDQVGMPRKIYSAAGITFGPLLAADSARVAIASSERSGGKLQFSICILDAMNGSLLTELWDGPDTSLGLFGFARQAGDLRILAVSNRSGVKRPLVWDTASNERTDFVLPELAGDIEIWSWSPDTRSVLLCQVFQAAQTFYRYDLEAHTLHPLQTPRGAYQGIYYRTNDELVAHWTSAEQPMQPIVLDAATGQPLRTLFAIDDAPASRPWHSVQFASADGELIQAWLAMPAGDGPFPTILDTHGGPTAVELESYNASAQMWLDHGFAHLSVNYRGSTTFGKAFEEQIWGKLGQYEVDDMVAARNWLISEGIADPDAILLTGWSYGGYLTLLAAGMQPKLWAGGMAGIAIADWVSQWEDTAPTLRGYQEALLGGSPSEQPEQYRRSSPISYAEQVSAPLLVIQGSNDTRCPARPMHEYEARLKQLGKDIELEWFDAGHGSYDDELQIQHHERMLRFAYRVLG
jgi:dipeptidyl aminopeptidase/acylaminoacyl peptidase